MQQQRQQDILRRLASAKYLRLEQLSELYGVSPETIRRDLLELEKTSPVKRVRGGAMYCSARAQEMEYARCMQSNQVEKRAIAQQAAQYIQDGDAVAINNGTATLELAHCLAKEKSNLTIVTNSPEIGLVMNRNESNRVYIASGYLRNHNGSLVGSMCLECLDAFKVDKVCVSIDGVSIDGGITEFNPEEAAIIRKMLDIGRTKMVLCEYVKFSELAFHRICPAQELDYIITDWTIPAREIERWEEIGVKVVPAEKIQ